MTRDNYFYKAGITMKPSATQKANTLNPTPNDLSITPRHIHFDVSDDLATLWHGDDAFKTAFYNALSVQFPAGEKQFIKSVRQYKDRIKNEKLSEQVGNFIKQEGQHTREHRKYNDALTQRGYDLSILEKGINKQMSIVSKLDEQRQLAGTCAAEHLTAVLAEGILKHPEWLEGASPKMKALWKWHAVEETEHKGVAFDVFQAHVNNTRMRRIVMFIVIMNISRITFLDMCYMLKKEGKFYSLKTWVSGTKFFWGKNGILRHTLPELMHYFKKDFHPWHYDSRELISQWESTYDLDFQDVVNA